MKTPFLRKADKWITKRLSYPGIDEKTLGQKKINWLASIAVTGMIFCLTLAYHIIFPQLRILIYYGLFLTLVFLQGVIYPIIFRRIGLWLLIVDQTLVAVATFFAIIELGGIPYSGGLVVVGLAMVFFSFNFRKKSHSVWIYIIYAITVILAGVLNPYLTVPPEMTPEVNISLYVINLLWISGFATVFVLNFISQGVKLEQHETTRLKELDEAKTKYYTYITHEFRTPLTVITGMTDLIRKDPKKWLIDGTEKIDRNAGVLLNLVNQMLDLSKLEAGEMPVRMIRSDINLYIRYIVELFQSVAAGKRITLNFTPANSSLIFDYDAEKLMHIVSNLISNALKFTLPLGHVEVTSSLTVDGRFELRVSDSGTGISEDFLPYIFDRFSREHANNSNANPGSGLGLALTKELVRLLNGTISAESVVDEGTEITVTLPVTYKAALQEGPGLHELKSRISLFFSHHDKKEERQAGHLPKSTEKHILLIVEDNDDVVSYLVNLFAGEYEVLVANNGEEGVRKAIENVPDIILSDIMMPVMDGIRMLDIVKNDLRTSHIPFVILTARADVASRLDGLARGADAYIAKPFDMNELQVQLRSLIEQRKKLQERYAKPGHPILSDEMDFHFEDAFMKSTMALMMANLSNENFDIQKLCHEMTMSRTQLYRKFRSLTDKSPNDYFRSLRLHKAKDLLAGTRITVAEAAYKSGFKNVSHFSRVFTEEFGIKPREIHK
jgi:signal transduction histidine kinase/DNA-binding response OmpR family regulator